MEFLQAWMLWGIIGVALPVTIHFWYQKKGEVIAWAASRWLVDETSLKHRGVRLHEILLLIIRCLLVLLLSFLLSQPILDWWKNKAGTKRVHLVQPNASVVNNYRFEIESALKAGEKVAWISPEQDELTLIGTIPDVPDFEFYIQNSINKLAGAQTSIYVAANQQLLNLGKVYVPGKFSLYTLADSTTAEPLRFLELNGGKKLYTNPVSGALQTSANETGKVRFASRPAHSGVFKVLVDYGDADEKATVSAAVNALGEVYEIPFEMNEKAAEGATYDWVLSDREPEKIIGNTLYMISGKNKGLPAAENVIYMPDSLRMNASEMVGSGRLPEWLGEAFVSFYGLKSIEKPLSGKQLHALFEEVKSPQTAQAARLRRWLLLLFVLLTLLERWLTLRKSTFASYA